MTTSRPSPSRITDPARSSGADARNRSDAPVGGNAGRTNPRAGRFALGALAGLVSAGVTLAVADLVASVVAPSSSPVVAVGETFIDLTPGWLKDFAVTTFGTDDKLALLISMSAVIALIAAGGGVLSVRRPRLGTALVVALGVVALAAALTRPDAGRLAALPSVAGVAAGIPTLWWLSRCVRDRRPGSRAEGIHRRQVLIAFLGTAGGAVAAAAAGRAISARSGVRLGPAQVRLPAPVGAGPVIPAGAEFPVPGLTPLVTADPDFYRVDTALVVPRVDAATWRLRVHGMVERPFEMSYADLLALPLVEREITMTCVSNEVGGDLAGNAVWLGYPLASLLARAGVSPQADALLSTSVDGFTATTPTAVVLDGRDAMVAVGMNGRPLPVEHGFPARLLVPGLYGYVSATKWITELEVTRFADVQSYWTRRGWAEQAPIRTFSRIDVPASFARVSAGPSVLAGMAWAQHRGIAQVEVQIDGGAWQRAQLSAPVSIDTWRQWRLPWQATPGTHNVRVRATDGTGATQPEQRRPPKPDGATGWHSVVVTVT